MSKESIKSHEDLVVYQMAFEAAMKIFNLSKAFPIEERYSLTDQIRRSSRSVCANLAEAWRKRRYKAAVLVRVPLRLTSARGRTALLLSLVIARLRQQKLKYGLNLRLNANIYL